MHLTEPFDSQATNFLDHISHHLKTIPDLGFFQLGRSTITDVSAQQANFVSTIICVTDNGTPSMLS